MTTELLDELHRVEFEHQQFRLQNDLEWRAKIDHLKDENNQLRGSLTALRIENDSLRKANRGSMREALDKIVTIAAAAMYSDTPQANPGTDD